MVHNKLNIFNAFKELSLDIELRNALEDQSGKLGYCYGLCLKIENNDLISIEESESYLNLDETSIMHCYAKALNYADESLS